jgi:hypothetical protein
MGACQPGTSNTFSARKGTANQPSAARSVVSTISSLSRRAVFDRAGRSALPSEHSQVATSRHEHHPEKVSGTGSLQRRGGGDLLLQGPSAP